jgi:uncharacterized membrane protein
VWYTDYHRAQQPSLRRETDRFVRDWMARMVERDNRMVDVNVMRTLTRNSQFFASTTMLILGALVALMGYAEKAAGVLAELPFTQQVSERMWELKILLLVLMIAVTIGVVYVLHQREFRSRTLQALGSCGA